MEAIKDGSGATHPLPSVERHLWRTAGLEKLNNPSGAPSKNSPRGSRSRTVVRGLSLPALLLTVFALAPRFGAGISQLPTADAASAPTAVAAVTAPAVAVPAAVQPAVIATPSAPASAAAFAERADGLSPQVLAAALDAVAAARAHGTRGNGDLLTVIDYSLPSTEPRLWVLDLAHGKVLFHELVAHGAGTGDLYATRFSNLQDSRQTSLGLFLTAGTYEGGNGYSLKLRGLEPGVNDHAEARHIVMHGAWYVSTEHARQHGRIGRSWGCPALSEQVAPRVIDTIKGGTFLFSYAGGKTRTVPQVQTASLLPGADTAAGSATSAPTAAK
jgi:hypothetical protein